MIKAAIAALLFAGTKGVYITTCHNDHECGAVGGCWENWDSVALTEGLLDTNCWCPEGNAYLKYPADDPNNRSGYDLWACPGESRPECSIRCGQEVCIVANGMRGNGVIRSACPKYHQDNVESCKNGGNDDYCTCIIRDTADLNYSPYQQIGGNNAWGDVYIGNCDQNTGINIMSQEAKKWMALNPVKEPCVGTVRSTKYNPLESQ